jgi:hypothetical protein
MVASRLLILACLSLCAWKVNSIPPSSYGRTPKRYSGKPGGRGAAVEEGQGQYFDERVGGAEGDYGYDSYAEEERLPAQDEFVSYYTRSMASKAVVSVSSGTVVGRKRCSSLPFFSPLLR